MMMAHDAVVATAELQPEQSHYLHPTRTNQSRALARMRRVAEVRVSIKLKGSRARARS